MNVAPMARATSNPPDTNATRTGWRAICRAKDLQTRAFGAACHFLEGQKTFGPMSVSRAGIRVSEASSISATDTRKAGAIVWNDCSSDSRRAAMAAMTTSPEEAMAWPTRATDVATALLDSSPARNRSR